MTPPKDLPDPEHLYAALEAEDITALRARVQACLPDHTVLNCLGRGGMGAVFRAHQLRLDRPVAIKVLLPAPEAAQGWEERYQREARALARLSHPGIVAVHDYGQADDLCWIVMEYVDGANLREVMQDGRLGPEDALAVLPQICAALQFAHDRGVVHRDLKPENVLLDESGHVRIADFGLAKLMNDGASVQLTMTDQAIGTLRYMAPEQLERPKEVDHRADIFSLGILFYEMLTGQVPVGAVQPPSAQGCTDPRLDEVVMRSMNREPGKRYQRASDVGRRLDELENEPEEPKTSPSFLRRVGTGTLKICSPALPPLLRADVDAWFAALVSLFCLRIVQYEFQMYLRDYSWVEVTLVVTLLVGATLSAVILRGSTDRIVRGSQLQLVFGLLVSLIGVFRFDENFIYLGLMAMSGTFFRWLRILYERQS